MHRIQYTLFGYYIFVTTYDYGQSVEAIDHKAMFGYRSNIFFSIMYKKARHSNENCIL
jgi:hypothetical protein